MVKIFTTADSAAYIKDQIENSTETQFKFSAGNYTFGASDTIQLNRSGVSITNNQDGDVNFKINTTGDFIKIGQSMSSNPLNYKLAEDIHVEDNQVILTGVHKVIGTDIQLIAEGSMLYSHRSQSNGVERQVLAIVKHVSTVSGNTVVELVTDTNPDLGIDTANGMVKAQLGSTADDFNGSEFKISANSTGNDVRIFTPVKGVNVSNINIEFVGKGAVQPDPNAYSNDAAHTGGGVSFRIEGAYQNSITNISIKNSWSNALRLEHTIGNKISDIRIDGSYNKGGGSAGYGVSLYDAHANYITDLDIKNTRHAVLFGNEDSVFFNYINVDETNRDVNLHGGPDKHNVVIVEDMTLTDYTLWSGEEYYSDAPEQPTASTPDGLRAAYELRNLVSMHRFTGGNGSGSQNDIIRGAVFNLTGSILRGEGGVDRLYGTNLLDELSGGTGNDALWGELGNDILEGGVGADRMYGNLGDDTYSVDNAGDITVDVSNGGIDQIYALISWTLGSDIENLVLIASAASGSGNALNNVITGNFMANSLSGGDGDDMLIGNPNGVLIGDHEADAMTGGAGNDTYSVDDGGDTTIESAGGGTDTVQSTITWNLSANVENVTLLGTAYIGAVGNSLDNVMAGQSGKNTLNGGGGNDNISGGSNIDILNGGDGNDTLDGGSNLDTLTGGNGADILIGGTGSDTFIYNATSESTDILSDIIKDYISGDKLDLSTIDADVTSSGNQAFSYLSGSAFTGAGQLRLLTVGNDTHVRLNTDANTSTIESVIIIEGVALGLSEPTTWVL